MALESVTVATKTKEFPAQNLANLLNTLHLPLYPEVQC